MGNKSNCEVKALSQQRETSDFVHNLIDKQLSWYAPGYDIHGKSPKTDPNHDYWKEVLQLQLARLRQLNESSMKLQGRSIMQDTMNEFDDINHRAHNGKITFREAYTQILTLDYSRVLRIKCLATHSYTVANLDFLKSETK